MLGQFDSFNFCIGLADSYLAGIKLPSSHLIKMLRYVIHQRIANVSPSAEPDNSVMLCEQHAWGKGRGKGDQVKAEILRQPT